jgi:hypothetical protein
LAISTLQHLREEDLAKFRATSFACPEWDALKDFWCRPYWKRIWVVQELAVANGRALIGCGSQWIRRSSVQNALNILHSHRNNPETLLWESIDSEMDWLLNLLQICRCDIHEWGDEHLQNLEYLLYLTEQFEASVPHDHFFALLGLSRKEDRLAIPVDYSLRFADICAIVLIHIIQHTRSLNILSGNRSRESKPLSSWMPSFSDPIRRGYGWNTFRNFHAAGARLASASPSECGRFITCRGVEIGTINYVEGPFENSKSAFLNPETILRMRRKAREASNVAKCN